MRIKKEKKYQLEVIAGWNMAERILLQKNCIVLV